MSQAPLTAEKLLPCPFCGGTRLEVSHGSIAEDLYYVECLNGDDGDECMADGPMRETREAAVQAWNRRATS